MADPAQLAVLTRVSRLRRDRSAAALAEAGRLRAAEDAALVAAMRDATVATDRAAFAKRQFAGDPADPQAQLWRRVTADRAVAASAATDRQAARLDDAVTRHDHARLDLVRADSRADHAAERLAKAKATLSRRRDERESDDRMPPGRLR